MNDLFYDKIGKGGALSHRSGKAGVNSQRSGRGGAISQKSDLKSI